MKEPVAGPEGGEKGVGKAPVVTPELLSASYLMELFRREVPVAAAATNDR
ncbi:MAG: hypothetical protein WCO57_12170 [Verrucomicrobiota bacterium]